ncbi:tRNA (adenosine(37)-N6)-threonylcarbamoyltransferase complex dimerization subunit type 1 TsaB [Microbacterium sp. MPKO10]|uniref:tRNA (adenosine(37)-N6)-threonylcarbamoyltransferase complex dimerization subunit type 1 TsaB n=1 Tax=Microbacterium sp. MPKO10 TaxID=2989818 RepID=UPI0022356D00|nr:tRNA (adenosine(37)-N6)-threonylcarbamoyltransferase complex dimerization subunit type 1 TsaB [Microbacterium sp. MPKO10]MCW4457599.1 tRNA (adenosine(37)-N6)-threonylcarbamoyltransferase complex dimerization subunit type 1 TsaB [Microbacterium sp. MPKO10]
MLLAIDSSIGTSAAVVDLDRGIIAERHSADTRGHAEVVGALMRDALTASGVSPAELSGVVAGMGPGPFTGLRIGIAAARAFAFGVSKPVVPVVSHDAIAFDWYASGGTGELLVVTDARRRENYCSRYSRADAAGLPVRIDGPVLAKPGDIVMGAATRLDADRISAGSLGMVAELTWAAGRPFAADEPLYLRSPDVTPSAGHKRVTS